MTMQIASVCSGIEASTVAWHPLGWRFAWYSEIDKFCCAVLNHHYPETPNLGDMTRITEVDLERHEPIDLLVGGTPCQSFSIAGVRKGLDDPRGNLALRFLQLAGAIRARWVAWENVPGILSSGGGRDFGTFLGAVGQLGYGWAYRILDAQYFGVPQRRRRVFVVGYLGDWRRAAAVLFERESMSGNPPPGREAGAEVAHALARGDCGSCGRYDPDREDYVVTPIHNTDIGTLERDRPRDGAGIGEPGDPMFTLGTKAREAIAFNWQADGKQTSLGMDSEKTGALQVGQQPAIAYQCECTNQGTGGNRGWAGMDEPAFTLSTNGPSGVMHGDAVRRLTPLECERLQGFPDGYTNIPYGRPKYPDQICPDRPRYRALGNSIAVPVMRWIGERIAMVEELTNG